MACINNLGGFDHANLTCVDQTHTPDFVFRSKYRLYTSFVFLKVGPAATVTTPTSLQETSVQVTGVQIDSRGAALYFVE